MFSIVMQKEYFQVLDKTCSIRMYFNRMGVCILTRILNLSGSITSMISAKYFFSVFTMMWTQIRTKYKLVN